MAKTLFSSSAVLLLDSDPQHLAVLPQQCSSTQSVSLHHYTPSVGLAAMAMPR